MTVLRGAAWACALVAGSLVVGGCTPDEPEPTPTTPVETSTSAPETSEPTVAVPELPGEARQATADGAVAWVGYWFELLNYAKTSGNTQPLRDLSGSTCKVCDGTAADIDAVYESDGLIVGGEVVPSDMRSPAPDARNLVVVNVTFSEEPEQHSYSDGRTEQVEGTTATNVGFVLVHEGGAWALREIGTP